MKRAILILCCHFIFSCINAQIDLWGLTEKGGANNCGVLFQYNLNNNIYTNKLDFSGTSNGSLSKGSLMKASDGNIYGMTSSGGLNGVGTIFKYDPSISSYTKILDFDGLIHGSYPFGKLMQASDGKLYGVTCSGGNSDLGTIFQYDINTNSFTKLLDFNGINNGSGPFGQLIELPNGMLYGLTFGGGTSNNFGSIFQFDPISHVLTKKFVFTGFSTGYNPAGSLVEGIDGKLYGMTLLGGTVSGTIFQYDPYLNTYSVVVNLGALPNDGRQPWGSLISALDGKLYGMTEIGGVNNSGILFQYDPISNVYSKKIDFDGVNFGSSPKGSLMQASDGYIYGLTTKGGTNNFGVLFQFDPITGLGLKKLDFDSINGSSPLYTSLIELPSLQTEVNINKKQNFISIYPTLNNGSFFIEINSKSQILVTNTLGETIIEQIMDKGKQSLSIQSCSNGIYFVNITDDKGIITSKKIIVNK